MPAIRDDERGPNNLASIIRVPVGATLTFIAAVQDNSASGDLGCDDLATLALELDETFSAKTFKAEKGRVERTLPLEPGREYGFDASIKSPPGACRLMLKLELDGKEVYRRYAKITEGNSSHRLLADCVIRTRPQT